MKKTTSSSGLERGLTLVPAAAIVIAIVIGTGIFVKARVMTCNVGSPGRVLAVYGLAGLLTLFGALAYAVLATMMPRAGGEYNYLGAAFGHGLLPRPVASLTPHSRAPRIAVLLIGGMAVLYAASGTFDILTDLFVFATLLFQALTVGALFVLRRSRPEAERPYRAWGYPVVPALYLLAVGFLFANTLLATPGRALAGLGLIALGLPVYAHYAHRLSSDDPADWLGDEPEDAEPVVPAEPIAVVA